MPLPQPPSMEQGWVSGQEHQLVTSALRDERGAGAERSETWGWRQGEATAPSLVRCPTPGGWSPEERGPTQRRLLTSRTGITHPEGSSLTEDAPVVYFKSVKNSKGSTEVINNCSAPASRVSASPIQPG